MVRAVGVVRRGGGGVGRATATLGPLGVCGVDGDQVPICCAGRELVCMAVSRFLKFPIQMNLSGKYPAPGKPQTHILDPTGPGGYMRKRAVSNEKLQAAAALDPSFRAERFGMGVRLRNRLPCCV